MVNGEPVLWASGDVAGDDLCTVCSLIANLFDSVNDTVRVAVGGIHYYSISPCLVQC